MKKISKLTVEEGVGGDYEHVCDSSPEFKSMLTSAGKLEKDIALLSLYLPGYSERFIKIQALLFDYRQHLGSLDFQRDDMMGVGILDSQASRILYMHALGIKGNILKNLKKLSVEADAMGFCAKAKIIIAKIIADLREHKFANAFSKLGAFSSRADSVASSFLKNYK